MEFFSRRSGRGLSIGIITDASLFDSAEEDTVVPCEFVMLNLAVFHICITGTQ